MKCRRSHPIPVFPQLSDDPEESDAEKPSHKPARAVSRKSTGGRATMMKRTEHHIPSSPKHPKVSLMYRSSTDSHGPGHHGKASSDVKTTTFKQRRPRPSDYIIRPSTSNREPALVVSTAYMKQQQQLEKLEKSKMTNHESQRTQQQQKSKPKESTMTTPSLNQQTKHTKTPQKQSTQKLYTQQKQQQQKQLEQLKTTSSKSKPQSTPKSAKTHATPQKPTKSPSTVQPKETQPKPSASSVSSPRGRPTAAVTRTKRYSSCAVFVDSPV